LATCSDIITACCMTWCDVMREEWSRCGNVGWVDLLLDPNLSINTPDGSPARRLTHGANQSNTRPPARRRRGRGVTEEPQKRGEGM
jgi:hypothetical protein